MHSRPILFALAAAAVSAATLSAGGAAKPLERFVINAVSPDSPQTMWPTNDLFRAPATFPVEEPRLSAAGEVRPIFFEGVPYRGKPTRVFAWLGVPKNAGPRVPGMVLIHGGGGTAFRSWVELWLARGYAAIALDTCGHIPAPWLPERNAHLRHDHAGPEGWIEMFKQIDEPVTDQWTYHAVADTVLAHSLLRAQPGVDPERTGVTGISWGGYLTYIVAGVDSRFKLAVPVYGTAFIGENSSWQRGPLQAMGREKAQRWLSLWDPSQYLPRAAMPMLFVNGTNDRHNWLDAWQRTHRLHTLAPHTLAFKVRMPHGHPPAGDPPEITAFADGILRGGPGLPRIERSGRAGRDAWVTFAAAPEVTNVELVWTADRGEWPERRWQTAPAQVDVARRRATATVPADALICYFNVFDARGLLASSDVHQIAPE